MNDALLEVATQNGMVLLTFTLDDGEASQCWLEPDETRDLCNSLGAAIKYLATEKARAW